MPVLSPRVSRRVQNRDIPRRRNVGQQRPPFRLWASRGAEPMPDAIPLKGFPPDDRLGLPFFGGGGGGG